MSLESSSVRCKCQTAVEEFSDKRDSHGFAVSKMWSSACYLYLSRVVFVSDFFLKSLYSVSFLAFQCNPVIKYKDAHQGKRGLTLFQYNGKDRVLGSMVVHQITVYSWVTGYLGLK